MTVSLTSHKAINHSRAIIGYRQWTWDLSSQTTSHSATTPAPSPPTAIQRTSEHIGFGEIIPITINGNSENVLIFDGESGVLIFRRSAL